MDIIGVLCYTICIKGDLFHNIKQITSKNECANEKGKNTCSNGNEFGIQRRHKAMEDRYLFKAKTAKIVDTYNNDVEDGVWVHGSLRCDVGKYTIFQFETERADYVEYEIDPTTICQCTGMKDKNGKLIWENDILDGFTYPYMSDGVHNYYVEVCWCTNVPSFCIYTQKYPEAKVAGISTGNTELMADWNSNDWEVIGNIFDNSELSESEG